VVEIIIGGLRQAARAKRNQSRRPSPQKEQDAASLVLALVVIRPAKMNS
jgi:hypothetical protein